MDVPHTLHVMGRFPNGNGKDVGVRAYGSTKFHPNRPFNR
jgi:hypothetical protein